MDEEPKEAADDDEEKNVPRIRKDSTWSEYEEDKKDDDGSGSQREDGVEAQEQEPQLRRSKREKKEKKMGDTVNIDDYGYTFVDYKQDRDKKVKVFISLK